MDKETAMNEGWIFERQKRDQEHRESMAMLAAEREAVERLRESYRALEEARAIEARERREK